MKKQLFIGTLSVFFSFTILVNAQQPDLENTETPIKKENTLNNQFDDLLEKSNSWQHYKVIERSRLVAYQKNVLDSLAGIKSKIQSQQAVVSKHEEEIKRLNDTISELKNNLEETRNEKDSVSFLGILLSKQTYSLVMWSFLLILASLLLFYVYKYTNGSTIAKKSIQDLNDLQEEYENYRKSAIEREQKVRRQLQDEINKHR